jgi:hypothetical protein
VSIGEVEFFLDQWLHREQHGAVDVIEKIQRREQD